MNAINVTILLAVALVACGGKKQDEGDMAGMPGMGGSPGSASDAAAGDHAGHAGVTAPIPEGHAEVEIAADRLQTIGVRLARAEQSSSAGTIRATAIIRADETREAHVHTKIMGWIRALYVNAVGQKVKKGQALYAIYSQELLVAQQEYLRARSFNPDLAAASRKRLRLWDVPEDQIRMVEQSGQPVEALTVRSPISGTVLEKNVVKGHFVEADMMLYHIADLSRVWVVADVYEYEVSRLDRKGGARVLIEGASEPLNATIDYVYPTVDPVSRTVKVRMVVANPKGELRPGNFATVELPTVTIAAIWVPDEAIIDTGVRQIVYFAVGPGRFRPAAVKLGRRAEGRTEVREGLAAGAEVVVSGQFLVDSESRLRATSAPGGHSGGH